ncbi:MAG: hypothetical protein Q9P44_02715 [Anaerolineae bacterium]|nr:hypothetical protein [Anaerolineae bacterium]
MHRNFWRTGSLAAAVMLLLLGIVFSFTATPAAPTYAQFEEPTATPRDPVWLAFSAARDAIEESEGVNLQIVQRWDFFQDDWSTPNANHPQQAAGIDSCDSAVIIVLARDVYFGWTFQITDLNGRLHEARVSFNLEDVVVCDIVSSPVAEPTAVPAASGETATTGDLPVPVAGSAATGSFELGGHVNGMTTEAINAMNQSGMTWVKKQLPISAGVQEGYNMINAAHSNGFKILLGIVANPSDLVDVAAYAPQYAVFAAAMAEAGADAIEVHNEMNIDREWPAAQISGANYVQLLAVAYNAIKTANPNTMVISGALAPTGFFGAAGCGASGCNDDVYLQQMADAGAAQYFDCVGIHYNEGIVSPGTFSGDPRGEYPTYYLGSMINRASSRFPGKPVCFTELGYLSGEGMGATIPPAFGWAGDTTVAEHAAWLADAASRAASRGDIRLMIVWNVNFTRWDSDPMGGYAILRPDGSCPACSALGAVMGAGG